MSRISLAGLFVLSVLCGSLCLAQNYKCDWSVNGIGGGDMAAGNYRCGATAGQTAAGFITASNYWALIGYWLPEGQVGIREAAQWPSGQVLQTRLYSPQPNPARSQVAIRYSLHAEARVHLTLHDLTGRVVRTLVASSMKRGAYSVTWDGRDDRGRKVGTGVYLMRMEAGKFTATRKLVVER
jgi:hypothetical protein